MEEPTTVRFFLFLRDIYHAEFCTTNVQPDMMTIDGLNKMLDPLVQYADGDDQGGFCIMVPTSEMEEFPRAFVEFEKAADAADNDHCKFCGSHCIDIVIGFPANKEDDWVKCRVCGQEYLQEEL